MAVLGRLWVCNAVEVRLVGDIRLGCCGFFVNLLLELD